MIELLQMFLDFFLNLDTHLVELLQQYGVWIYAILFLIVFSETGLVVTPWLPGDSLLFAVGALVAIDSSGTLQLPVVIGLLIVAAMLGNTCNYAIGKHIGPPAFCGRYRLLRVEHLQRTDSRSTAARPSCCRGSCRSCAPSRPSWPASAAWTTAGSSCSTCWAPSPGC
jgi:membrane-associated protein